MIIFDLVSLAICVIWMYMLVYLNYTMRCLPILKKQVMPIHYDDADLPMVSIIIPACNEEEHLEQSLLSRLNQDYPRFELIVVNDRSTDGTKAIIDRIAAMDSRLIPLEITELPESQRPNSKDPDFWDVWIGQEERPIDWSTVVADWGVTQPAPAANPEVESTEPSPTSDASESDDVPF